MAHLQQHVQLRGHEAGAGDALLPARARQVLRVPLAAGLCQQQHAAAGERVEQLLHRRVEADGRLLQEHVAPPQLQLPADARLRPVSAGPRLSACDLACAREPHAVRTV